MIGSEGAERKEILLSILPKWAEAILNGEKRWEYRKVPPKAGKGDRVILYATRERREIVGEFVVGEVLKAPLDRLISCTIRETPHEEEEIRRYFSGLKRGSALKILYPKRYDEPIPLRKIKEKIPNFVPPQNFVYLRKNSKYWPILELLPKR